MPGVVPTLGTMVTTRGGNGVPACGPSAAETTVLVEIGAPVITKVVCDTLYPELTTVTHGAQVDEMIGGMMVTPVI